MPLLRKLFILSFLLSTTHLAAQINQPKIHDEINLQVWKPFCISYSSLDVKTYNSLHTDDVIRATPWGIRVGDEYKNHNIERFKANKEKGAQRTIELWFEHRKTTPEISYEVGYYKVTYKTDGNLKYSYGRFHVVMKKVKGTWKIAQDWDTDKINGIEVSEKDWLKGSPITFD